MTSPERPDGADLHDRPADGAVGDPVADFAVELRELRGQRSYRQLAQVAHYSHTALSQAAAGRSLPSLAVTQAFVRACGGDVEEWSAHWREVDRAVRQPGEPPCSPGPCPSVPGQARADRVARSMRLRARSRIVAAGMAIAVCVTAVVLWAVGPFAVTSLPGRARPGLRVESSGLYIGYAAVTNRGTQAGYAYVLNTGAGKLHRSSQRVQPGHSWTYYFNRDLKDGAKICGSVDLGPATCTSVHA